MKTELNIFDEHEALHDLNHYLPAQAPLKDFIHHNTLHAFQKLKFKDGIRHASEMFGYKVSLSLEEFRSHYASNRIKKENLERVISERKGAANLNTWMDYAVKKKYDGNGSPRIGALRSNWTWRNI